VGSGVGGAEVEVGVGEAAGAAAPQATATAASREARIAALGFLWSRKLEEPGLVRPGISFHIN
jgi:hypothetical protein